MVSQTYDLNMIPGGAPLRVKVSQYDAASRTLRFRLHTGGTEFTVPSGSAIRVTGTRPDGGGVSVNANFSGSTATVLVSSTMTEIPGPVRCQLTVFQNGVILGSACFILQVEPAALTDGTVIVPAADVVIPGSAGLSGAQAAILPLSELASGLSFGGQTLSYNAQAGQMLEQLAQLISLGIPIVTSAPIDGVLTELMVSDVSGGVIRYYPIARNGSLVLPVITVSETAGITASLTTVSGGSGLFYAIDLDGTGFDPSVSDSQSITLQETLPDGSILCPPAGLTAALIGGGYLSIRYTSGNRQYTYPEAYVVRRPSIGSYQAMFRTPDTYWKLTVVGSTATIAKSPLETA